VDEYTACIDGQKRISLDADHFKINKFWGLRDPSFDLVYHEIERMAQRAPTTVSNRRTPPEIPRDQNAVYGNLRQCLRDMEVTNPHDFLRDLRSRRGKRVDGTCEWILEQPEFTAWRDDTDPRLLRLVGPPGIGKTMVSTFLADTLEEKVRKTYGKLFAFFFCDNKVQGQRSPDALLRSLIWQLLLQRNELYKHVQADYELYGKDTCFKNVSSLWRMFENMIQDQVTGEVFILIDALDECDHSSREALLAGLHDLFESVPATNSKIFKFVITCRPEIHDIQAQLHRVSSSLRIDSAAVNADLVRYIDFRVDEHADYQQRGYPKKDVKKALKEGSGGTFLWVSLMIADLKQTPMHKVMAKLQNPLPKELPEIYATILDRISQEDHEEAQFILRIMVAASRPLTKLEIAAAFAAWKDGVALVGTSQELYMSAGIFSSTGSIILDMAGEEDDISGGQNASPIYSRRAKRPTVHFCHQSVKDFLLSCPEDAWYHIPPSSGGVFESEVCWRYFAAKDSSLGRLENACYDRRQLEGAVPHTYSVNLRSVEEEAFLRYPFLDYAMDSVEDLAAKGESVLLQVNVAFEKTPLIRDVLFTKATNWGWERAMKLLHEHGASPNVASQNGWTPLMRASLHGHEAIVHYLLKHGAKVNFALKATGATALQMASSEGHLKIVELLIDHHASVDFKNLMGETPLFDAARYGHRATVDLLLQRGADVNVKSAFNGDSPLHRAAQRRRVGVVERLLLENEIEFDMKNYIGRTPLHNACEQESREVVELLLSGCARLIVFDEAGQLPFWEAIRANKRSILELAIERGYMTTEYVTNCLRSCGHA
jgi:ankyrin repeat protein